MKDSLVAYDVRRLPKMALDSNLVVGNIRG
jgi:hypothetical protein